MTYGNTVGVTSGEVGSLSRIAPFDPDNSYLVRKVLGAAGIVGGRMPKDGPPYLTLQQIDDIRAWVAAGAKNN